MTQVGQPPTRESWGEKAETFVEGYFWKPETFCSACSTVEFLFLVLKNRRTSAQIKIQFPIGNCFLNLL